MYIVILADPAAPGLLAFFLGVSAGIVAGNTSLQNQPLMLRSSIKQGNDAALPSPVGPGNSRVINAWAAWPRLLWVVNFVKRSNKGVCFPHIPTGTKAGTQPLVWLQVSLCPYGGSLWIKRATEEGRGQPASSLAS